MKRTAAVSIVLLAGLALGGCSAANTAGSAGSAPQPQGLGVPVEGGVDSTLSEPLKDSTERSLIVSGTMTVTAKEPLDAAAEAIRIVEGAGGRIDGRQEYAPVNGDKGSAILTLRIPSEALDATIDALKELGEVEEISTSSKDVTSQVQDIDARVTSLRVSVERLTEMLSRSADIDALLAIELSLSQRQGELESMLTQQRSIGDQGSLASVTLSLISEADAPVENPDTFLSGLEAGWTSFVAFLTGTVVVVGVLLPWLVFFALVAAVVMFIIRRRIRRVQV
jgi:PBP1b-binding outer membrane lipoprotein LpoB